MATIPLHGLPVTVEVAPGYGLRAAGLRGRVSSYGSAGDGTRSSGPNEQMLDQVSTLVKDNPDGAAALVKRWLNRD